MTRTRTCERASFVRLNSVHSEIKRYYGKGISVGVCNSAKQYSPRSHKTFDNDVY